jgi:predicted TPR repeat methyltransferase
MALADLEADRGDVQAGIGVLADLLVLDPYHLDALSRLGDLLLDAQRPDDAARAYRRVLRFDGSHDGAVAGLARCPVAA